MRARLDEIRAVYSTVAHSYDDLIPDTRFEAPIDLAMVQHFLDQVGTGRSASVLDAGCGAGRMMGYLETLDPTLHLTGVDLAPGMVARARLQGRLHDPSEVTEIVTAGGFEVRARLDRSARPIEKNAQGFLVATRT